MWKKRFLTKKGSFKKPPLFKEILMLLNKKGMDLDKKGSFLNKKRY